MNCESRLECTKLGMDGNFFSYQLIKFNKGERSEESNDMHNWNVEDIFLSVYMSGQVAGLLTVCTKL